MGMRGASDRQITSYRIHAETNQKQCKNGNESSSFRERLITVSHRNHCPDLRGVLDLEG